MRILFLLVGAIWISGCGSLPNASALTKSRLFYRQPKFVGAEERPISSSDGKAIIAALEKRADKTDILERHLAFEQAISGVPLTLGNQATLLQDGPDTYKAMFDAMREAKDSINVEVYTIANDEIGRKFADALLEEQRRGVQVNLIYDSFGSLDTPRSFFDELKESGIQVLEFNPVNPLAARVRWAPDHRDHRKLLIVDGEIAFTGGINFTGMYAGRGKSRRRRAASQKSWRDTDLRVEGPAVAEFQRQFMDSWQSQHGAPLSARNYFPALEKKGDDIVRVMGSVPEEFSLIYVTLISAINNAETKIYITDAYFAPGHEMLEALTAAAQRGVDVRILVPGRTDQPLLMNATRSDYSELLRAGVQIYEWQGLMIHAKTATIDNVWSTVGSSNLDWWSLARNDEINAMILGYRFAQQMESVFKEDIERSDRIDPQQWKERGFVERSKELLGTAIEPML